jgi:phosphoribosylanthranilate isomerase
MSLKITVGVGNITNLSEARYCAGMGVNYLCFPAERIDPENYKAITGWINGPACMVDISKVENATNMLHSFAATGWLVNVSQLQQMKFVEDAIIFLDVRNCDLPREIDLSHVRHIVADAEQLPIFPMEMSNKLLLAGDSKSLISKIEHKCITGIWLDGTEEDRPGLKDYSNLESILGQLEIED